MNENEFPGSHGNVRGRRNTWINLKDDLALKLTLWQMNCSLSVIFLSDKIMILIYHRADSIGKFPLARTLSKAMQRFDCFVKFSEKHCCRQRMLDKD
jgi:hypothetical protein